jgi:hypothetical protein
LQVSSRVGFGLSSLKIENLCAHFKDDGIDVVLRVVPAEEKFVTVGTAVSYFAEIFLGEIIAQYPLIKQW